LESELFGHVRGAFTGATNDRHGLFQLADDGTLFLDEIGDLPAEAQVKLLRVLDAKPFKPIGGEQDICVDVRVLAATNKDLAQEVEENRFRQDLFFRLKVVVINVPPLRDHLEDLPELVDFFIKKVRTVNSPAKTLTPEALARLQNYHWPGNVRELWSVLEHAILLGSDSSIIHAPDLDLGGVGVPDCPQSWKISDVETWVIRKVLSKHQGNITKAAQELGLDRGTLKSKVKDYGIEE
jgi:transcriptional regulator with PAS, ATPase and Fis domain